MDIAKNIIHGARLSRSDWLIDSIQLKLRKVSEYFVGTEPCRVAVPLLGGDRPASTACWLFDYVGQTETGIVIGKMLAGMRLEHYRKFRASVSITPFPNCQ